MWPLYFEKFKKVTVACNRSDSFVKVFYTVVRYSQLSITVIDMW